MEYKSIPLADYELKAGDGGWTFSAYSSTFGNRDHGHDVIEKGAFIDTLKDPNRDRPLLWQHMGSEPIGKELSLAEDSKGLFGSWEIVDTQRGSEAYKLMKRGIVRSMSIGYMAKAFDFADGGDTRVLKTIDLLENSVVSIPMNDQARITTVKHLIEEAERLVSVDTAKLSLVEHSRLLAEIADSLGERTTTLLEKLQAGEFELTEAKRSDLQALLETFSGLDAVRLSAMALVEHEPELPVEDKPKASALSRQIQIARARARLRGVEV